MSFGILSIPKLIQYNTVQINDLVQEVTINFDIDEKDFIYKDFITISSYEPMVTVSPWKTNIQPITYYDPVFKDTKQIFNTNFTISLQATAQHTSTEPMYLYCSYYRRSEKKINHLLIPLFFIANITITENYNDSSQETPTTNNISHTPRIIPSLMPIHDYYQHSVSFIKGIIKSFKTDHKKYFLLFNILIIIFLLLSHFFKERLNTMITLKELNDIIISLLGVLITIYSLFYINIISTPLITLSLACGSSLITGLFYTKKSTKLQSGYLRTLCTFIGTLALSSTLFLAFKTMQYY